MKPLGLIFSSILFIFGTYQIIRTIYDFKSGLLSGIRDIFIFVSLISISFGLGFLIFWDVIR